MRFGTIFSLSIFPLQMRVMGNLFFTIVVCFILSGLSAFAQNGKDKPRYEKRQVEEPSWLFEDTIRAKVVLSHGDTLLELAESLGDSVQIFDTINLTNFVPRVSMDLLADRLNCIEKDIPLTLNKKVAGFIDFFTIRKRNYTQTMTERKDYYFPLFEKYLAKYGLPDELKYLSIVESGLSHSAVSRTNAVGLWQFMSGTARDHKLVIDYYRDERMDPEKSTEAACKYLKLLYRVFGDWELVLASYNCGLGRIKQVMRKTGKNKFWEMYDALPQETRAYVPQFVAVVYAMNYTNEHNIFPDPDSVLYNIEDDTVTVHEYLSLPLLSRHLGVPYTHLKLLNPTLRKGVTPHNEPYVLHLPAMVRDFFVDNRLALLDSVGKSMEEADKEMRFALNRIQSRSASDIIVHRVRRGESIFSIASQYRVKAVQIRAWNNLVGNFVKPGRKLVLHAMPPIIERKASQTIFLASNHARLSKRKSKKYTVQPGDTLWAITQKHEGLTVDELIRLNKLKGRKIVAGQKLIVG